MAWSSPRPISPTARSSSPRLEAGKDVYVEKPMSIDLEPANKALDLARAGDRVVQAGTQRRSDGQHIAAAKLVATGILGRISRVTAEVDFNEPRWARGYGDCKQADVDWDAYLFNRPKTPFDPRLLRRWHLYKLCTNGLSGLWMSHYADAVHMIVGAKYPAQRRGPRRHLRLEGRPRARRHVPRPAGLSPTGSS